MRILGKLEGQNPGGSVKDRIAKKMIEEAEADGTLTPGKTILEPSSGNTGIALAMIGQIKGYPVKIVLPGNVSPERRQLLEVFGAEIIDSPAEEGSNGAVRRAEALAAEHPEWAFLYQYGNEANPRAHYEGTGPEIWADCPRHHPLRRRPGHQRHPARRRDASSRSRTPTSRSSPSSRRSARPSQGLRNMDEGYIPPVYEKWGGPELLDGKRIVRPLESLEYTRRLAHEAGIFAGISSGAALAGAVRVAEKIDEGVIVFIVCDGGWKYLSTGAWTDDLDEVAERVERVIYF